MPRRRRRIKRVSIWEVRLNDGRHLRAFGYSALQALCIITDTVFPGKTLAFVRYEFEPTSRRIPDGLRIRIGSTLRTAGEWCRGQEPGPMPTNQGDHRSEKNWGRDRNTSNRGPGDYS